MVKILQNIRKQIANPAPDIDCFIRMIKGEVCPKRVHLAEFFADQEIVQWYTVNGFAK